MTPGRSPNVYLIAGPNGAGKTTFATEFLPEFVQCREFVNADLIAAGLSPFAPETRAVRAGRLLLTRIKFSRLHASLVDAWHLYDGSKLPPTLIADRSVGPVQAHQPELDHLKEGTAWWRRC